jgi:hypothetical protein
LLEESLRLAQELDDMSAKESALLAMGQLELAESKPGARERMRAALQMGTTKPREAASGLAGLAALALKENDPRFAAQLLGAIQSALAPLGLVVQPLMRGLHARTLIEVRSALGDAAFEAAFEEGGRWTLAEAARRVLAEET